MPSSKISDKEKKIILVFFWCMIVPAMVAMFMRMFYVVFRFILGTIVIALFGSSVKGAVVAVSVALSLGVTVWLISHIYRLLKRHILDGS